MHQYLIHLRSDHTCNHTEWISTCVKVYIELNKVIRITPGVQRIKKSLERRYDAYKYGPVVSVDNSGNVVIINKMTIV